MPTFFHHMPDPDPTLSWDDYITIIGILNTHFDNDDRPEDARNDARDQLSLLNDLITHREDDTLNGRERAMLVRGVLYEGSSRDESYLVDQPEGVDIIHNAGHSIINEILKDYNLLKRDEIVNGHADFDRLCENSQREMNEFHTTRTDIFSDSLPHLSPP